LWLFAYVGSMGRKRKGEDGTGKVVEEDAAPAPAIKYASGAWGMVGMHPEIVELCDTYHVDEFHTKKLHDMLMERPETMEADIIRLWNDLAEARNPNGLLNSFMKQMDEGTFVGQCEPDPEMMHLIRKFNLDAEAKKRLTDCVCRHKPEKKTEVLHGA